MSVRRIHRFIVATALSVLCADLFARPLPSDARIVSGKLANGVTWMYRRHDNPPGKMALMLHVDSGSLNETDAQRGLAHFIEHMCFNGSEHYPPGKLIPYFESIGMEFGADLNAFTSFDQTSYMLFLPDPSEAQVDQALTVLSDYAFRVSFVPEEIEKERGVVLEESRTGKNAFQRIRDKLWPELFEGSRFARRLPIGDDTIIAKAPREEFLSYYRSWYRPENMTVLLVGDAAPEPYVPMLEKWFGAAKPTDPAQAEKKPEFKPFTQARALVATDPEMAFCDVSLINLRAGRPATTTTEQWRTELIESIGSWIIGRRFEDRVQAGTASFRDASAAVQNFFQDAVMVAGSANGEPQDWSKMLDEVIVEIHRAQEFGFTERELELAKKELLAEAERAVRTESTRDARFVLFGMLSAVNDEVPILSAQQELELHQEFLPTAQLVEVNETFKRHFQSSTYAYVVQMVSKEGVPIPSRDQVLAAAIAAWNRPVEAIKEHAGPSTLLVSQPAPGTVVDTAVHAGLNVTSVWLTNGARVHHRFMDYKKDTLLVTVSLSGGPLEETPQNAGVTEVASLAVNKAATNRLSSTAVRDMMTGKNTKVSAGVSGDFLTISVTGSPKDLAAGLELVYALLTDGKIEESAFQNWKLESLQQLEMSSKFPQFKAFEAYLELLSGGDPRLSVPNKARIESQSHEAAQARFDRIRREAPIEVSVVGDMKLEDAIPLIEQYIGSLPNRERSAKHLDDLRKLPRTTGPLTRRVEVETMNPQAMVIAGFLSCEGRNVADRRAIALGAEVLTSRLVKRIREDLSLVYSISARNQPSWVYQDSGTFLVNAPCDPKNADRVVEEVGKMIQAFTDEGPTAEELANAKKQIANNLDTEMREPAYWSRILSHHEFHRRDLDQEQAEREAFEPLTAEQVRAVFQKYNVPARRLSVTALPKPEPKSNTEAKDDKGS